jgi:hypothetical protein
LHRCGDDSHDLLGDDSHDVRGIIAAARPAAALYYQTGPDYQTGPAMT